MKNYAFISYSHRDLRQVRRFHRRLELFSVPGILRKLSKSIPKRIFPVFRDETDLAGTTLTPKIEEALQSSAYLIVICTKHSADSDWVKLEIEAFLKTHGPERIIPVFLDYKTKRAFQKGFPNMLSGLEASRSNAVKYTLGEKRQALFDIASRLLERYSPELSQRFSQRQKLRLMCTMFFGIFLAASLLIDSMWIYKDHYDIRKYCRDIAFCQEWPEPVKPLNPISRLFCEDYYECTYRNNRIIRIRHITPEDTYDALPGTFLLETPIMEFAYNNYWQSQARISRVVFRNSDGQVLFVKNHALDGNIVDLTLDPESSEPFFLPRDMTLTGSDIPDGGETAAYSCRIAQFYDDIGRIEQVWFLSDTCSEQVCDSNGYYGLAYEYSDSGQPETVHCLGLEGEILKSFPAAP